MEWLEKNLQESFDLPPKHPSEEALRRWRSAVSLVRNPRRRFRMVADLDSRSQNEARRRSIQENFRNFRVAVFVHQAAVNFIDGAKNKEYRLTEDIINAGFSINPDELASITSKHDVKALKMHGGVDGISKKIRSTFDCGISASDLDMRQNIYGVNRYAEKPSRSFWMFVWDALQDMTLIILMVCALISAVVGLASEGFPKGMYDGLGIILSILLVVMVTAISDYRQSLQFKELDNEKKKIFIHVTRDGSRQKISIYDLAVGDIVHLSIGDQVPADGLYIHGYSLLIDESSLTGESDPVYISQDKPFILAGTKVQDGSAKMMVTAVGMRTEWGRLMSTLSEGGEDETPLQGIFENTSAEVVKEKDGTQTVLGTPTERAIFEFGLKLEGGHNAEDRTCTKVKVEPFNSVKKKMAVLVSLPNDTYRWFSKGASEIIVQMCDMMVDADGNSVPLSEAQRKNILDTINSFASDALRTLCLAYKEVDGFDDDSDSPTSGFTLISIFGIKDPVRSGVKDAVKACMSAGIIVRMVTGDNINTAKAIAKECGILTDDGIAIEGPDFRNKSPEEMRDLIPKIQVMARSLPLDKHTLVTNLRGMFHEVVAVTGDGTNDAPALHEADIGLAMGIAGTEVAKESADVIVLDDNFTTIINVARWGRAVYINIQKFVQFQLTVNVVALVINFVSACITGSAPLTAVQLLWVNMIMDTLGALALATEPPNDEMMKRPPVRRGESFITKVMWQNIIGQSLYQLVVLGALMFGGEQLLNIKDPDSKSVINTLIFNSFVFCQVFNEINSREMQKINVFRGMISNWIFIGIIAVTVAFQVVIIEFLGTFASTVPLSWQLWLVSVGLGFISLIVGAILKCIPVKSDENPSSPNGYVPLPSGPDNI
ncbi:putative calcium-transporting ATPase 4, plasma membrane-type [Panicum miliaceum]|uniref:Calcium-transporting ATPase n=1 Tax=Panicum miliaceum TaxID=4540 RepID=A0A3L6PH47_PANMI|nr:putative calcium-transporting ATPase 4, plasma membrane-type [Panicum miliaceum]